MIRTHRTQLALLMALMLLTTTAGAVAAQTNPGRGLLRGGLGFDPIGGGVAFNLGAGYGMGVSETLGYEGSLDLFYSDSEEDWEEGNYVGTEKTTVSIVALRFNWVFKPQGANSRVFPTVGVGLFWAGVEWSESERFIGDTVSSFDDFEGSTFGNLFNFGLGFAMSENFEARLEAPVMIFYSAEGDANSASIPIALGGVFRF